MKQEDWDAVIQTNLASVFRLSKAVLRGMMKARKGRIISIASVVGVTGNPGPGQLRGGQGGHHRLHQVARSRGGLARHYGERHRARIHRHGHDAGAERGAARELERAKCRSADWVNRPTSPPRWHFWPLPEAAYITGETLHVNGGMYMA